MHQFLGYLLLNVPCFGAKRSAFWCKMQCVLMLNAVCFDAKRKVKWCKMQLKMVLNATRKAYKYTTIV